MLYVVLTGDRRLVDLWLLTFVILDAKLEVAWCYYDANILKGGGQDGW